jgi:hypothetical protein
MVAFRNVALLHSHPRIALTHEYHIADLVELCGLAAFIRDSVDDVWIPVTPNNRTPLATVRRQNLSDFWTIFLREGFRSRLQLGCVA